MNTAGNTVNEIDPLGVLGPVTPFIRYSHDSAVIAEVSRLR